MKWLTEYFNAEAMIVSRCEPRRRLFADGVVLREAINHRTQFHAMHIVDHTKIVALRGATIVEIISTFAFTFKNPFH